MARSQDIKRIYDRSITELIDQLGAIMGEEIEKAFREQGHNNTGSAINSIEKVIERSGNQAVINILMNDYVSIVNRGVSAANIPYRAGSGKKSSKYIDGLIRYFQSKGLGLKEAKGAAFATARVHKREGMPTRASKRFSSTGKRTGFLEKSRVEAESRLEQQFESRAEAMFEKIIIDIAKRARA